MDRALLGGAGPWAQSLLMLLNITVIQSCMIYLYQSTLNDKIRLLKDLWQ